MDGPRGHGGEISQPEKDKYCTISLICKIQKKQTPKNGVKWWLNDACL